MRHADGGMPSAGGQQLLPLVAQVHETVPQALLPLEPQLREELEGEGDGSKRRAAVELVAKLLTQHPGGASKILDEYEPLLKALLGRANDVEVSGRVWRLCVAGARYCWGVLPGSARCCNGPSLGRHVWLKLGRSSPLQGKSQCARVDVPPDVACLRGAG